MSAYLHRSSMLFDLDVGPAREGFPAEYLVEPAEAGRTDLVMQAGGRGETRRAVAVLPLGGSAAWSAALCVPRPLLLSAVSGDFAAPRPDAVLLVERGSVSWVEVDHPERYRVIRTDGPVVQVEPVVPEGLVLLVTPWSITGVAAAGPVLTTPRIAIEGLRLDQVADGWLHGVADPRDDEPRDFAVNLRAGELIGGAGVRRQPCTTGSRPGGRGDEADRDAAPDSGP